MEGKVSRREALTGIGAGIPLAAWTAHAGAAPPLSQHAASSTHQALRAMLGEMPDRPPPAIRIINTEAIEGGSRYKIEYLAEPAFPLLHLPEDRVRAYLLVPEHKEGARLPAILAMHQDGPHSHIGKNEPAGLAGDANLHYGVYLFRRGYVTLCADRFYHAERRRGVALDSVDPERDEEFLNHTSGQFVLRGRTAMGKEAYDAMVGVDVLRSLDYVDPTRIGAIGHSAGGLAMIFAMFLDRRIRAGVSSCGYFDPVRFFDERAPKRRLAAFAIPGLARLGSGSGYLAGIAPRALLLTRGLWEWGDAGEWRQASIDHVQETRMLVAAAMPQYRTANADGLLRALYFDENGGGHDFPAGVRQQAYAWLDAQLTRATS